MEVKKLFLLVSILLPYMVFSQGVRISSSAGSPDPSAILELDANNKGLLIPQVSLTDETDNTTINNPADGLLVFNTNTTAPMRKGFYFWSSADNKWHYLYSGHVPTIPGNVEFWIRPDGAKYIRPEYNANARVYDAGQNWSFYYEGTNKHGAFFAGGDVGVIGQRAGTDTSVVPEYRDDDFPFYDVNADRTITKDDKVTYTGLYAFGDEYMGVTGIAKWDAGVRGIGLGSSYQGEDGTNGTWPVVGVIGEVIDVGYPSDGGYGQQGVYGWQAATPGSNSFCLGVLGTTAQTGAYSAGVGGFNVTDVSTPASVFAYWKTAGFLGYGGSAVYGTVDDMDIYWAGYFYGDVKIKRNLEVDGDFVASGSKSAVVNTSEGQRLLYCVEAPEVYFEDFGTGQLKNGIAKIEIDPLFLETITIDKDHPYMVYITLTSPNSNGVYVEKYDSYFIVRENNNGKSNASFDWRLVAKRKGFENRRFEPLQNKKVEIDNIKPIELDKNKEFKKKK